MQTLEIIVKSIKIAKNKSQDWHLTLIMSSIILLENVELQSVIQDTLSHAGTLTEENIHKTIKSLETTNIVDFQEWSLQLKKEDEAKTKELILLNYIVTSSMSQLLYSANKEIHNLMKVGLLPNHLINPLIRVLLPKLIVPLKSAILIRIQPNRMDCTTIQKNQNAVTNLIDSTVRP